jgi:hypothetical protein
MGLIVSTGAHGGFDDERRRHSCADIGVEHSSEMIESIRVSPSGHRHQPVGKFRLTMKDRESERRKAFAGPTDQALGEDFVTAQS